MTFIHSVLGVDTFPRELQTLSFKYITLQILVCGIYLSNGWISLYYLAILDSFEAFGFVVGLGLVCGIILDIPLGYLTDRLGQRLAYCGAMWCLVIYYLGLIVATRPFHLAILEIVVGIYSALLSGSYSSWFMNSWDILVRDSSVPDNLFRKAMGNITFAKTLWIILATLIGGILLQQGYFPPQVIFISQASIATIGIMVGYKFVTLPNSLNKEDLLGESGNVDRRLAPPVYQPEEKITLSGRISPILSYLRTNFLIITPFLIGFALLSFTSVSFRSLILTPLLYELDSNTQAFRQNDIVIQFTAVSILLVTWTRAFSDILYAISCRISGRLTTFVRSPYWGIIIFYLIQFPVIWLLYAGLMISNLPNFIKTTMIILVFFCQIIIGGLATGMYWQLYYKLTSAPTRSTQESLYNTINLLVSLVGFTTIGAILGTFGFIEALIFLFVLSCGGILLLVAAKNPFHSPTPIF
ncbi:MAG: MFS transporter [Candidatus Thorarchaeota archaeon]